MKLSTGNIISWSQNYSNWLPIIQWSGWIIIVSILAKLFWVVTLTAISPDVSKQTVSIKPLQTQPGLRKTTNISNLINRHLFGEAQKAVAVVAQEEETDIPETQLNLKLRGVYSADNNTHSNSIIEDGQGKQAVYFVEDKLAVAGNVFLKKVYVDRVVLDTNGRAEELRLREELPPSMQKNSRAMKPLKKTNARTNDKRKNQQISRSLNKYREQLLNDPLSLTGIVNFQPKMANGKMIGFVISPGRDKRLFTQLGLRSRDVITSINGVSLSNPQDAMALMSDVQNMQELEVQVNRGNETINLLLNLSNLNDI